MDTYEKAILLIELAGASCLLDHGPGTQGEKIEAVDYLICPLGFNGGKKIGVKAKELAIPVCHDCVEGLADGDWTLLFCLNCLASKWILRPIARLRYRHNLIWLGSCPKCSSEFGGIYFNDPRN